MLVARSDSWLMDGLHFGDDLLDGCNPAGAGTGCKVFPGRWEHVANFFEILLAVRLVGDLGELLK